MEIRVATIFCLMLIVIVLLAGCTQQAGTSAAGGAGSGAGTGATGGAGAGAGTGGAGNQTQGSAPPAAASGLEKGLIRVPDPLSGSNPTYPLVAMAAPAAGATFKDASFGTSLTRVTKGTGTRNEYSRFDPFNSDRTMIALAVPATGEWNVYRAAGAPYDTSSNLAATISMEDPRWDPDSPEIIWGLRDFGIVAYNVSSGLENIVKDFSQDAAIAPILRAEPDLYRITMNNEGESSLDKRYWAFILQGSNDDYRPRYIFTWDRTQGKVLGTYKIGRDESSIDWVGMSTLGNYVLIGGDDTDRGSITGFMMADRELKRFHKLDYATAHSDTGLDTGGKEVLVMQNTRTDYIDMIPIDWGTKSIDEAGGSYAGTNRVQLARLFYASDSPDGLNSGVHISCNAPGYCVVSTTIGPGMGEQNWLDRGIILVKLNATQPEAYYVAKVYGTTQDYWEETHATISSDGKRVVWATNWNQSVGTENAGNMFAMEARLG